MQRTVVGHFSPEFLEGLRQRIGRERIALAYQRGEITFREAVERAAEENIPLIEGAANAFYITNAVAQGMLASAGTTLAEAFDAGTAAVIEWYDGTPPADADAAEANTLLGTNTCAATAFTGTSDGAPGGVITFDAISDDTSADASSTATHFRIKTQTAGTVVAQGTIGTSASDLVVNTTTVTAGSTLTINSGGTITLPEGP